MDFWACAEGADRLCNSPGKKHKAGVKQSATGEQKGAESVLGRGVSCSAAASLAKSFLPPRPVFPMWIMKFPCL